MGLSEERPFVLVRAVITWQCHHPLIAMSHEVHQRGAKDDIGSKQ